MNKRKAKKHKKFTYLQKEFTLYGFAPKGWSEIRWARQIVNGRLRI